MAKRTTKKEKRTKMSAGSPPPAPTKAERRRWKAEEIVRDEVTKGPAFARAVRAAEKELIKVERAVESAIRKK